MVISLLLAGELMITAAATSAAAASTFPPFGHYLAPVAADCSQDVARAFNDWLKKVPDRSTIHLIPRGCYLVNETTTTPMGEGLIVFSNKHNIAIDGHGSIIKTSRDMVARHERALLYFELGGAFVVRDLTLQGVNSTANCAFEQYLFHCYDPNVEGDAGIRTRGVDGVLLDNVHLKNIWGDGLEVDPAKGTAEWDRLMSRNVTIQNSTVDTVGRHAFTCTGCHNFAVHDNTATNIGYHVVDVETEGPLVTGDLTLLRNTFSNFWGAVVSAESGEASEWGPFVARGNLTTDLSMTCKPFFHSAYPARYGPITIADNTGVLSGAVVESRNLASQVNVTGNIFTVWQQRGCLDNNSGLPGGLYPGVILHNTETGYVTNNTFVAADTAAKLGTPTVTVCSNRFVATAAFDQPMPCKAS